MKSKHIYFRTPEELQLFEVLTAIANKEERSLCREIMKRLKESIVKEDK